ncbi:Zinc transporter ZIP11-like protein [Aix galericulata]|nr:Zinc transporter ZIP11-like protein [Aix galericulata]
MRLPRFLPRRAAGSCRGVRCVRIEGQRNVSWDGFCSQLEASELGFFARAPGHLRAAALGKQRWPRSGERRWLRAPTPALLFGRNLAIGIGIQNFPEGLAVSLPLRGAGFSTWKAFWAASDLLLDTVAPGRTPCPAPQPLRAPRGGLPKGARSLSGSLPCRYGQLSGMVEPLAGVFGAFAVVVAEPLLPYALGFAAGAMVYVVMDDIIPEAQTSGNGKLASWTSVLGFVVMMSLDVGLG